MSEGQTELQVTVTQGEDEDPEYVNRIATETFELPPNRPANRPIQVRYSYDVNQRMHCSFMDEDSGRSLEVEFCVGETGNVKKANVERNAEELSAFKVQ